MSRFEDVVRKSMKKDFESAKFEKPKRPHPKNVKRIVSVDDASDYARFRGLLLGRLVRLEYVAATGTGIYVTFVNESDRKALNDAGGWSDNKHFYLLDKVKFDD